MTEIRVLKNNGDIYYPQTHAQAVMNLNETITKEMNQTVFDYIRIASPNETVFSLSVTNDGLLNIIEDVSEQEVK